MSPIGISPFTTEALSHNEAITLAVDRIDFGIDAFMGTLVDEHMDACETCSTVLEAIAGDQQWLSRLEWDSEQGSSYDDDDEDQNDLDGDAQTSIGIGPSPWGHDDDEDDESESSTSDAQGTDSGHPSDDGDDEDETDATAGGSSAMGDGDAGSSSAVDEEAEAITKAIEEAAKAEADAMSDETLGDLDHDAQLDDAVIPDCAADGVEQAARDAGVSTSKQEREEAERTIRAQDGVQDTDYGKVAVSRSTRGLLKNQNNSKPKPSHVAAAAIRNAILRSRGGHTGVELHQSRGRLDSKGLWRIAAQDPRLFKRTKAPSPTKLLVWVMVDCSGSMAGSDVADAAAVARAMADASSGAPSMRIVIWAWSNPFLRDQKYYSGAVAGVCKVWETGQATSEIDKLVQLPMGGTPDATVLDWAWRAIKREAQGDEVPLIVMASDGQGDWRMPDVVAKARTHGVGVRSVAIGYGMTLSSQMKSYGRGKFIPWAGSIIATARPLATMLADITNGGAP